MTRVVVLLPTGRGCLVCRPSRHPGYVRVESADWPRPTKTIPCPVCSGGDLAYALRALDARTRETR